MNIKLNNNILKLLYKKEIFLIFFSIYFLSSMFSTTMIVIDYPILDLIFKYLRYITYIFFFYRSLVIIYKLIIIETIMKNIKNNKKNIFIFIIILILIVASLINLVLYRDTGFLIKSCIAISCIDLEIDDMIDITGKLQFLTILFLCTLCAFGGVTNFINIRGETVRNSLGFGYPLNLASFVLFPQVLYFYEKKFKLDYHEICLFQIITIFAYFLTDSKGHLILSELIVLFLLLNKTELIQKVKYTIMMIEKFSIFSLVLFPVLSYVICYMYKFGGIFYKLNSLLSNRLAQTFAFIQEYGISLFGTGVVMIGKSASAVYEYGYEATLNSNFIDNFYMKILYNYGVIVLICITILFSIGMFYLYKEEKHYLILVCFFYFVYGLINHEVLSICYSPMIFVLYSLPIKSILEGKATKLKE